MKITKPIEVKLIVLYTLKSFMGERVKRVFLSDIIRTSVDVDYIDLQENIAALIKDGYVESVMDEKSELLSIGEQGREALKYFKTEIPKSLRDRLDESIPGFKAKKTHKSYTKAEYIPINENEYLACLEMVEKTTPVISLKVNVGSKENALDLAQKFNNYPDYYFKEIFKVLKSAPPREEESEE